MAIKLSVFEPGSRLPREEVLPNDHANLTLRAVDGASTFHAFLQRDGSPQKLRLEIKAFPAEEVQVQVSWNEKEGLTAKTNGPVLWLPPECEPLRPVVPIKGSKLDLVLLLDGTSHWLNLDKEKWKVHLDSLVSFAEECKEAYPDLRTARVAFGDEPMEDHLANADDLLPAYTVLPGDLAPFAPLRLRSELAEVYYTSGGDYFDALANGLHQCREMYWRPDARKILVVSGDSPGHRLLDLPEEAVPGPRDRKPRWNLSGADARPRLYDIDEEIALLHDMAGVEILAVFLGQKPDGAVDELHDYTWNQYQQRIASLPQFAWRADEFDPPTVCESLNSDMRLAVARGSSYPVLVKIE